MIFCCFDTILSIVEIYVKGVLKMTLDRATMQKLREKLVDINDRVNKDQKIMDVARGRAVQTHSNADVAELYHLFQTQAQ